jgi:hypothetical protein
VLTRSDQNQTLDYWLFPLTSGPLPFDYRLQRVSVPPVDECVEPLRYVFQPDFDHAPKAWVAVSWILILGLYLWALSRQLWLEYPGLSVFSQALLMASHIPLLKDLGFSWYLLSSTLACAAPVVFLCFKGVRSWAQDKENFTLPSSRTTEGAGHVVVFLMVQVAINTTIIACGV